MAAHGLALPNYFSNLIFGSSAVPAVSFAALADGRTAVASLASRLVEAGGIEKATKIITDALTTKIAYMLQMPLTLSPTLLIFKSLHRHCLHPRRFELHRHLLVLTDGNVSTSLIL